MHVDTCQNCVLFQYSDSRAVEAIFFPQTVVSHVVMTYHIDLFLIVPNFTQCSMAFSHQVLLGGVKDRDKVQRRSLENASSLPLPHRSLVSVCQRKHVHQTWQLTAEDFKINVLQTFPSPFDFQLRLEEQVPLNTGVAQVILLCCLSRKAVPRWAVYWHSCGGLRMYQIALLTDILWCCQRSPDQMQL